MTKKWGAPIIRQNTTRPVRIQLKDVCPHSSIRRVEISQGTKAPWHKGTLGALEPAEFALKVICKFCCAARCAHIFLT